MDKKETRKDEILEHIWVALEQNLSARSSIIQTKNPRITDKMLDELIKKDYLIENQAKISFTERGEKEARQLIRAHRLAERLFKDILEIKEESFESNACTFEHILNHELCTAICTLLGHPKECPHAKPIPPGICCKKQLNEVQKVIYSLNELKAGESGKIAYISTAHHKRLDQLIGLGITPGNLVLVHQIFPTFVIKVGETDIALDTEICKEIYIRRLVL